MATLQKIRNNAGLLVSIFIGFALLAFIMGDLFRSGKSMFAKSQSEVGEIDGKSVSIQQFQVKVDENVENYKKNTGQSALDQATNEQLREQTWNQMVREYLMLDKYEQLGIGVSGEELFDMVQGNNIDPQVMQIPIFKDPQTGRFDRTRVIRFLKSMEMDETGKTQASWSAFEKALVEQKIDKKYNTLVEKGLYVTNAQAKAEAIAKQKSANIEYLELKYNTVSDSAISYSDEDLMAYYKAHKDEYKQEELRELNYVTFPVIPSAQDDADTKKWVENLKSEFESIENNEQYVNLNSDVPFKGNYYTKEELPASIQHLYDEAPGTVFGAYKEDNSYKLSKVVNFKNIPDSVKARHILIAPSQGVDAQALADSLTKVIKNGGDFAELAKKYSQDKGSASKGGDLGWFKENTMVKPFNDSCFFGNKGDIVNVVTQYGVHIIEIQDQGAKTKKVQIATIVRNITPSTKTYQSVYAQATKFGGSYRTYDAFIDGANKSGYSIKTASVKRNDKHLANLDNPRQIIRWTYEAKKGDVSEIFELDDMFVIATVKSVQEDGIAPFENVTLEIEREVKKDKKAEYLASKIKNASGGQNTLQAIAEKVNTSIKEAQNITFASYAVPGIGYEPEVQAISLELGTDAISEPIKGRAGVFAIQVKSVKEAPENINIESEKLFLTRSYRSRVNYQVYDAIKEAAEIKDNRSRFY